MENPQSQVDNLTDIAKSEATGDYARQSKVFRMFNPDKSMFIGFVNLSSKLSDKVHAHLEIDGKLLELISNGQIVIEEANKGEINEVRDDDFIKSTSSA
tara:strand:+ start:149 stop:445 length:297 start_codon:yes stop_codon:yes gene_type:complete